MVRDVVLQTIDLIKKQFLCNVSLKHFAWHDVLSDISWEEQAILVQNTVDYLLVLKRPLKLQYQKAFIKFVLDNLQKQNSEIHDAVYEAYGRLVALVDNNGQCYKHFEITPAKILSFKENSSIISGGTTGLCSWQASVALADWCLDNTELFENKTVLELGSGVGVTGITLGAICSPKKIYLTDCHNAVLEVLRENVSINSADQEANDLETFTDGLLLKKQANKSVVEVHKLPWEIVDQKVCKTFGKVDLIIAADVVYDADLFLPLVNALKCFLTCGTEQVFLACTERNKDTLDNFFGVLDKRGMNFVFLKELVPQSRLFWPTEVAVKLYSVKLK